MKERENDLHEMIKKEGRQHEAAERHQDEKGFKRGRRRLCRGGPDGGNKAVCNNTVVTKYVVCHALSPRRVAEGRGGDGEGERGGA